MREANECSGARAVLRSTILVFVAVCAFSAGVAIAQDYPNKPIRFIVSTTPGTILDIMGRVMGAEMTKSLGKPIIVENKPGAGGAIAYEYVAKQTPADGYTVAVVSVVGLATIPLTERDMRFDPLKDLPPFIGISEARFVLASSSGQPWRTFKELVTYGKANAGKLNYGTSSTSAQLATHALFREAGIDGVSILYTDSGLYFQSIVSGDVHVGLTSEATVVPFGEKLRVLAVTGDQRSTTFPDAPTFTELGYPKTRGLSFSLNVRAGTAKPVIDKLYAAGSLALKQPEVKSMFAKTRLDVAELNPEAAVRRLAEEGQMYAEAARRAGNKPQ